MDINYQDITRRIVEVLVIQGWVLRRDAIEVEKIIAVVFRFEIMAKERDDMKKQVKEILEDTVENNKYDKEFEDIID